MDYSGWQSVSQTTVAELEVKQSRFIAHLVPITDFDHLLEQLKSDHPKARHFVTASRYLNHYEQIEESFSDDGEPKGTSGMPTLKVLQGNHLINVGLITVRYFGGTKLGTGGLVRAYGDAANLVIGESTLEAFIPTQTLKVAIPYDQMRHAEYLAKQNDIIFRPKDYGAATVEVGLTATTESLDDFVKTLDLSPLN